jgi:hypothetical protein
LTADRPRPLDLGYAPPSYKRHAYTGEGEIVRVRVGREVVGYLTRQGDAFGWLTQANLTPEADTLAQWIGDTFREGALSGVPFVETWAKVLDGAQHNAPKLGPLGGFQG